jgi:hypothetical protein
MVDGKWLVSRVSLNGDAFPSRVLVKTYFFRVFQIRNGVRYTARGLPNHGSTFRMACGRQAREEELAHCCQLRGSSFYLLLWL